MVRLSLRLYEDMVLNNVFAFKDSYYSVTPKNTINLDELIYNVKIHCEEDYYFQWQFLSNI